MRILVQTAAIALAGGAVGLGANALSPRPARLATPVHSAAERGGGSCADPAAPAASPAPRIAVAEAKALCDACAAGFVDARTATEYAAGHVTDAVHLPPPAGHPGEAAAIAALRAYRRVVVYDGDYRCALADEVAARLRRAGLPDVSVLEGAWPAWIAAGGPGVSGACAACGAAESHP